MVLKCLIKELKEEKKSSVHDAPWNGDKDGPCHRTYSGVLTVTTEPSTDIIEYRTLNEAHAVLATLDKRLNCQTLRRVVHKIGTSYITVMFIVSAGDFTEIVCEMNGGVNCHIGFAETGHTANFYYRIIPETRGFGLNYESVDICGGMAGYL